MMVVLFYSTQKQKNMAFETACLIVFIGGFAALCWCDRQDSYDSRYNVNL